MGQDASQNFPLTLVQGATLIKTFTWYGMDGDPVNLAGYTAQMDFRTTVEDTGDPLIELSTGDGSIVINGAAGTITIIISAAITAVLTNGQTMVYNLFLTSGTGIVTPLLAGPAVVQGSTIR